MSIQAMVFVGLASIAAAVIVYAATADARAAAVILAMPVVLVIGLACLRYPELPLALLQGGMGIIFAALLMVTEDIPDGLFIAVFAAASLMGATAIVARHPGRLRVFEWPVSLLTACLAALVVFGVSYSWHTLAGSKAMLFVAGGVTSYVVAAVLDEQHRRRLYFIFVAIAAITAAGTVWNFLFGVRGVIAGRYDAFGMDVISTARTIGLGIIVLLFAGGFRRLRFGLLLLLLAGLLLPATRGAIVSVAAAALLTPVLLRTPSAYTRLSRPLLAVAVAGLAALGALLVFAASNPDVPVVENWGPFRLLSTARLDEENVVARFDHLARALQDFIEQPLFGWGTAGYGGSDSWRDPEMTNYPHNLILELLSENGLVGAAAFCVTLVIAYSEAARLHRRARRSQEPEVAREIMLVVALLTFTVANSLFSGSTGTNRTIWLTLGLAQAIRYSTLWLRVGQPAGSDAGSRARGAQTAGPSKLPDGFTPDGGAR